MSAGGNLAAGIPMVLLVLLITSLVAFIESEQNTPDGDDVGCDSNGNATTCDGASPQSFLNTFFDVSVTGIDDAPAWFNGFYVLIMAGVLVGGLALVFSGVAGSFFGGG